MPVLARARPSSISCRAISAAITTCAILASPTGAATARKDGVGTHLRDVGGIRSATLNWSNACGGSGRVAGGILSHELRRAAGDDLLSRTDCAAGPHYLRHAHRLPWHPLRLRHASAALPASGDLGRATVGHFAGAAARF